MGDPAGIGPEVIAKAWAGREAAALPPFFAVGDARAITRVWDGPVAPITVVDYEELVAERRLTMIVITRPEV